MLPVAVAVEEELEEGASTSYQTDFIRMGFCDEADKTAPPPPPPAPLALALGKLGDICVHASSRSSFARSSCDDEIPHKDSYTFESASSSALLAIW